jgi:hypothetical protein
MSMNEKIYLMVPHVAVLHAAMNKKQWFAGAGVTILNMKTPCFYGTFNRRVCRITGRKV